MPEETALPPGPRKFASAAFVFARLLKDLEADAERKARKDRVLRHRLDTLRRTIPEAADLKDPADVKATNGGPREREIEDFVDVAFCVPFAPYELEVKPSDYDEALHVTGTEMSFPRTFVDNVVRVKDDALGAHARGVLSALDLKPRWTLVVVGGLATAAFLTVLPAVIGGAAGLAGAAATAHGLAFLGGGSLAVGGFGMTGGTWVLAGLGTAAVGTAGVGASELVRAAPPEVLRLELAKLQTTIVLRMENGSWKREHVLAQLRSFDDIKAALEKDLSEELELNDRGTGRIRAVEDKLAALKAAREWIAKKLG